MTLFGFGKIQVPDPASGDLWWHQQGDISCFNPWKISAKSSLIQFHVLPCNSNDFRPCKMVLRNKDWMDRFLGAKKIFFNSISWYRDDLSIVFTKLG